MRRYIIPYAFSAQPPAAHVDVTGVFAEYLIVTVLVSLGIATALAAILAPTLYWLDFVRETLAASPF